VPTIVGTQCGAQLQTVAGSQSGLDGGSERLPLSGDGQGKDVGWKRVLIVGGTRLGGPIANGRWGTKWDYEGGGDRLVALGLPGRNVRVATIAGRDVEWTRGLWVRTADIVYPARASYILDL
jgi:hypothetical protein